MKTGEAYWGTYISQGRKVISTEHVFKYINNESTLKNKVRFAIQFI